MTIEDFWLENYRHLLHAVEDSIVPLSLITVPPGDHADGIKWSPHFFSGFLLNYEGTVLWLTAGHILDKLCELIRAKGRVVRAAFADRGPHNMESGLGTPVPLEGILKGREYCCENNQLRDIAAIPLSSMQLRLLKESPARAIPEVAIGWHPKNYDLLFVLGFPNEQKAFNKKRVPGGFNVGYRAVMPMLPLELVRETPRGTRPAGDFSFAKILSRRGSVSGEPIEIVDIDGMSGGPVFGLREVRGVARLEWVGIQSGWYRDHDIVSFTNAATVLRRLKRDARSA
ncbi:MAG: hypothetical protein ACTS27_07575 [Phycisphaerales bacterium]